MARLSRQTKETNINIELTIEGSGKSTISTGIGFFDHMLDSMMRHAAMDADIQVKGDLHIDMHHSMEDTGIVLGQVFRQSVGASYAGLTRFGTAFVPMDETLVQAAVDLCNRPYLVWNVEFLSERVGEVDTELFREFFYAFAMNAGICLHLRKLYGTNSHHIAEASFKALGRALRSAAAPDPRLGGAPASTKGVL